MTRKCLALHKALLTIFISTLILMMVPQGVAAENNPLTDEIDWPTTMADHDLIWSEVPKRWADSPFLGNGEQGTMMYQDDARTIRWDIGCSSAHDHRSVDQDDLSVKLVEVLNRGRLFIGHLRLELPTDLTGWQSRLNLWDAEATGTFTSGAGSIRWTTMVHATAPVMRLEITSEGDLAEAEFKYIAEEALSARGVRGKITRDPENPPAVATILPDGVQTFVHHLHAGGQTAVALLEKKNGKSKQLWLSVQHSFPDKDAEAKAVAAVRAAAAADQQAWVTTHRNWWHSYYPASFISTGDSYWDAFYWIQQYKRASATRDKGWIIDNQGPWLQPTAWNSCWWNLNVQLAHSGVNVANRREMGSALSHRLGINRENLARNVAEPYRADSYAIGRCSSGWDLLGHAGQPGGRPPIDPKIGRETGNLLWAVHNVDLEYRYSLDAQLRDEILYPLLKGAVNYYRHFLVEEADGLLHLPETFSPEYRIAEDCSYDISLLHWGINRLLELAAEQGLSKESEPLIEAWTDLSKRLVPVHIDETGIMIGRNKPLGGRHRHWSHLLSIYPLRTLTPETKEHRELIIKSLDRWHSFGVASGGYALTGGSCMASLLGDGDRALDFINRLKPRIERNTFYTEAGTCPVIETPLHAATALQEMLLQSWGNRLRVFPAVGEAWTDVQFHQLRGEGAFLVSARREDGKTKWTSVTAEAGGSVEVEPGIENAQWISSPDVDVTKSDEGIWKITTKPGDWVLFWPEGDAQPEPRITAVQRRGELHRFGMPKGDIRLKK